ncbi:Uncharacterised protein [Yersinia pseudotuberculosis]|uniref:hypothetical protein n=1 Tax=Yersinia pseudotuberculosis TaxID=633 RepID=UPI0005E67D41|nr:hypothetical protein [Yersinia pseudotuberculosis]MBO1554459.1 hypothetical protein [Yersinia pseudotuberculosis]MBO1629763.1 hypothetical protein [Yersinia pseudotuberculosis]MBP0069768.1 hypothetical protein [Yersinia pseudotuberculosis]CNK49913.1 Uncharacterised protein [Yersinia pseudotuberculosis]SUP87876.1 Uncharacterised protein [Yersinia pseudotuberculosis]
MSDIYHHTIVSHQILCEMSGEELSSLSSCSEAAFYAITKGLTSVGNLISSAIDNKDYEDEEARSDLRNIGTMLQTLPRIAEAMAENCRSASYIIGSRNAGEATK